MNVSKVLMYVESDGHYPSVTLHNVASIPFGLHIYNYT